MIKARNRLLNTRGFTLVELLVGILLMSVLIIVIYKVYQSYQRTYLVQEDVADLRQNLRFGLLVMSREIRMAGCNPLEVSLTPIVSATSNSLHLQMDIRGGNTDQKDNDEDGTIDEADEIAYSDGNPEDVTYTFSSGELRRNGIVLAENIEDLGFAYAFDADEDGQLDTLGGNIIWAVDTNGDNQLDLSLDTNGDGRIDLDDDTNGDGIIDGTSLSNTVGIDKIRAVRIWLLARCKKPDFRFNNTKRYVVCRSILSPSTDQGGINAHYRMKMFETFVKCRNLTL